MRVLILGGGGREHALAWAIARSSRLSALLAAPGNPGIARHARCVAVRPDDVAAVRALARAERIDLVVVGPEAPLVAGVADALAAAGIAVFGPTAAAARLEASKAFCHEVAAACGAPMAAHAVFEDEGAARAHLRGLARPPVVKADGLAGGKGVVVAETMAEAEAAVAAILAGRHGPARAVIEERLVGEEVSLFALTDGRRAIRLPGAQDHKRIGEGDTGPNTGGMGAYSPAPALTEALAERAMAEIVEPVIAEMAARGAPYRGVLYAGLMLTAAGPRLVEINARFGDPEAQVLLLRAGSDILPALMAAAEGDLSGLALDWRAEAAMTVVMAAEGYPGAPVTGAEIAGLAEAEAIAGVTVFQAGTAEADGRLVVAGGRVLAVSALGADLAEARERAYRAAGLIRWPGAQLRRDIGGRALGRGG